MVYNYLAMIIQRHADAKDMNRMYDTVEESDPIKDIDQLEGYPENFDHIVDQENRGESNSAKTN